MQGNVALSSKGERCWHTPPHRPDCTHQERRQPDTTGRRSHDSTHAAFSSGESRETGSVLAGLVGAGAGDPCEGLGFLWGMATVPHVGNALEATWLRTVESLKWWILYSVNFTLMKKTHKADREIGMQYSPASQGHIKSRWGLILKQVGIQ